MSLHINRWTTVLVESVGLDLNITGNLIYGAE